LSAATGGIARNEPDTDPVRIHSGSWEDSIPRNPDSSKHFKIENIFDKQPMA
jgi:hypothetical protein